jgi:hypothetical protein
MPKVETQNLASHEKVSAIYIDRNVLIDIEFVACETQDFASLLWAGIMVSLRHSPYIIIAAAMWRRKILRIPLNPQQHTHTKKRSPQLLQPRKASDV